MTDLEQRCNSGSVRSGLKRLAEKFFYGIAGIAMYIMGTSLMGYNPLNIVPVGGGQRPGFVDTGDITIESGKNGETILGYKRKPYELKLDPPGQSDNSTPGNH